MIPEDFIALASGQSINPNLISHIDFSKPTVMIYVGSSAIPAEGEDADTLRVLFGRDEEIAAEAAKTKPVVPPVAAPAKKK